ncbi:MAG: Cys-tRNA(Pro) deacylase [Clostridia bacterium]|nr:Cys-tRNA(Pro) deacylase [Clostridia bacterium]
MDYKTNVMRILDKMNIGYQSYSYKNSGAISGVDVAEVLNQNENQVFKTLVTVSKSKTYYVFMVPVSGELDLKKAATSVGEKSIEMVKLKELLPITGYVHGGCSPIGMKKKYITVVDISAENFDTIIFSAGKIGYQVEVKVQELLDVIDGKLYDIIK